VNEANNAPVVTNPGNRTVNELANLAFTVTATDSDLPAQTITWSLTLGTPAATGATIGAGTGAFSWTPTEAQGPGVYPVTITATDNGTPALSGSAAITITVNEVNLQPVVTNPGNRTTAELVNLAFTVTATDGDLPAQTLTFSLDAGAPAGAAIGASTGAFSWTPTEAQGPGTFPVVIRATDNGPGALSGTAAITITVTEANVAPVLGAIGNRTGTVAVPVTFTATATDADVPANTLTFSLDAGAPAGATIGASTGAFSWTPSASGTFPVTVRVTDNGSPALSDFEAITITVGAAANQAPVLGAIGNRTVNELATLTFTATATDPNAGDVLTFSLDAGSPAGATINGSTGAFSWTPTEAQGPGSFPITVRVTDNGSPTLSDFEAITVTVNEVNVAPVLAPIGNKTVNELSTLTITATATDADLPANALTFSLVGAPPGAAIVPPTGVLTWTPTEAQGPGVYNLTVVVTDDATPSLSDQETFSVNVFEVNAAPVLAAIADKTVSEGSLLTFTATATDADIPANTLTFSLDAGAPAGATITAGGVFSWTPPTAGTFPVTVRVTDNGVPPLSDAKSFTIIVQGVNHAPVLTQPADMSVNENATADQQLTATDPDAGDVLTFSKVSGPAFMTVSGAGNVHLAPGSSDAGVYTGTVRVTDNGVPSLSDTKSFEITVNNANGAPTADADGPYNGSVGASINFDGTGSSDPDGDVLTYAWDFGDGGTGTGSTPAHAYAAEGVYNVTLVVTDPDGLSDDDATTATIIAVISAQIILENGSSTIDVRKTGSRSTKVGIEQSVLPNTSLIPTSIRISHTGPAGFVTECAADTRFFVAGDMDADGVPDMDTRFTNKCLANLFNNIPDNSVATIVITGEFSTAGGPVPLHAERAVTIRAKHRNTPILVVASPNPFNPETSISYTVRNDGPVTLKIYSIDGRLVRTLKQGEATVPGTHEVTWNGTDNNGRHVSSGIYFVKTSQRSGGTEETSVLKLALTK
jgi:PKD repeat protein